MLVQKHINFRLTGVARFRSVRALFDFFVARTFSALRPPSGSESMRIGSRREKEIYEFCSKVWENEEEKIPFSVSSGDT